MTLSSRLLCGVALLYVFGMGVAMVRGYATDSRIAEMCDSYRQPRTYQYPEWATEERLESLCQWRQWILDTTGWWVEIP